MRVRIGSQYWNITWVANPYCNGQRADGYCENPKAVGKRIVLRSSLRKDPERLLCVIFHEILHASGWHLDEEFVDRYAEDAARIVTKLGFTLKDKGES
jgi:hypothetical protein